MDFHGVHSWTLGGLLGAFVDLVLAYFLLCGSALVFIASKVCSVFGLYLPCPCSGILGYRNRNLCLHKLFVDLPIRNISYVQMRAKSSFPFSSILSDEQACKSDMKFIRDGKCGKEVLELEGEGEASCTSFYGVMSRNLGNRESGYDTKGKRSVNQKQRSGIRRRRRAALEFGKFSSVLSSGNSRSVGGGVPIFPLNSNDMKTSEISQSLGPVDGEEEDNVQGYGISPTSIDLSERSWHSLERSGSFEESKDEDNNLSSVGKVETKAEDKPGIFGNEANRIRMLEQALEEEKAASAALYLELEKERAAAASATDEAMAMILRLQKEKASLEMEARQYERMIDEKFAHDEDEMNILKEILVRRERENHFLEKELENYRQVNSLGDEELEDDLRNDTLALEEQKINSNEYQGITIEAPQTCTVIEKRFSCDGERLKKDGNYGDQVDRNLCSSMLAAEPTVYDVHVVDDKTEFLKEENDSHCKSATCAAANEPGDTSFTFGVLEVQSGEIVGDYSNPSKAVTEPYIYRSGMNVGRKSDSRRKSLSAVDGEKVKVDCDIEWLREMLRIVQDGKEKLTVSEEHRERDNAQLKLLEEMANKLREVQQFKEPLQQASLLPPSSSKVSMKRRRCRSVPWEAHESD